MKTERHENKDYSDLAGVAMQAMQENYFRREKWPRLKPLAFTVWVAMMIFSVHGLAASVSRRRLMNITGAGGKASIGRAIKELLAKGYIERLITGEPPQYPASYYLTGQPRLIEARPANPQDNGEPLVTEKEFCDQIDKLEKMADVVLTRNLEKLKAEVGLN